MALKRHPLQVACYNPGIGTLPLPAGRTRLTQRLRHLQELLFGFGAIENVTELYQFLMEHYRPNDRIFLFGFSRGAFTVRALAGMIHTCGLLRWEDRHLVPYAAGLYQTSENRIKAERRSRLLPDQFPAEQIDHVFLDEDARRFKALVGRKCTVDFMGIWDTVKAYGWLWPQSFPALRHNRSVKTVRHAVSIDERRSFFQVTRWADCHPALKEVWFAGDHADVGGGHNQGNSPLTDAALEWMLGEATQGGLLLSAAAKRKVETLQARRERAWSTRQHDLWADGQSKMDWIPRVELNNEGYPPARRPSIGRTGSRMLGATDKETCKRSGNRVLLVHSTVRRRGLEYDPAYSPAALIARTAHPQDMKILWVEDGEITGFTEEIERNGTA